MEITWYVRVDYLYLYIDAKKVEQWNGAVTGNTVKDTGTTVETAHCA